MADAHPYLQSAPSPRTGPAVDLLSQRVPPGATREDRVALLIVAANALRNGEPVPAAAGRLLGDALDDWLRTGGSLERRLRVGLRGSHDNIPRVVARLAVAAAEQ